MQPVGHIRVAVTHGMAENSLNEDLTNWLQESGWGHAVSFSIEKAEKHNLVEFIPGELQSNGPWKIHIPRRLNFASFQEPLRRWLSEIV